MKKNTRTLDRIADDIQKLERKSIFEIGDLLIEAKAQSEHGQWGDWLDVEFDWSADTADNYIKAAELASKFRNVRNLRLAKTTIYDLASRNEDDLPSIVAELEKHAIDKRLSTADAEDIIAIGISRRRHGDLPDATLAQLLELDEDRERAWHEPMVTALKERKPETAEAASSIVDEVFAEYRAAMQADEEKATLDAEGEIAAILSSPPTLPAAIEEEPQRFASNSNWAESAEFTSAVRRLLTLHTRPIARMIGAVSIDELRRASDLIAAVMAQQDLAARAA